MPVTTTLRGSWLHICISHPPVNAISRAMRRELLDAVTTLQSSDATAALLYCAGRTFIAGADIREMGQADTHPLLPEVMQAYRQSAKPVVACLHGTPRGGGVELSMACQYRVALQSTSLGLPEVALGLVPGSGGTQCLPRLVDTGFAIEMITSAKPVSAGTALRHGLLHAVFAAQDSDNHSLLAQASTWFEQCAADSHPQLPESPAHNSLSENEWCAIEQQLSRKSRGQPAPLAALSLIRAATELPLSEGLALERDEFLRLRESSESKALRHLFFAERAVARPLTLQGVDGPARSIDHVGVIGGGLMGSGISTALLNAGLEVILIEQTEDALQRGQNTVNKNLSAAVTRGLLSQADADQQLARLKGSIATADAADCDLVIEAVFEDMVVKQAVFRALDQHCKADAILASNTSYLDINQLSAVTKRPESVLGLHFFSPAHIMKLLEIVRTDRTSAEVLKSGFALAKKLQKTAVLAGVCDGFIGNRILRAYRFQAETLLEEGCLPQQVDAAVTNLGFPMGPFTMQDLAGLDISWAIRKQQAPARAAAEHYVTIADQLCELGRFGQKSGAGWYRYEPDDRKPLPDPVVESIVLASGDPQSRRSVGEAEIQARILAAMANEGAAILQEQIAERPLDIDVVLVNGYGFPRHLGGPMHYADTQGLVSTLKTLEQLAKRYPYNVKPAALLRRLTAEQRDFNALNTVATG